MEGDAGKLFVGGLSWDTTEERLKEYFQSFGEVLETVIMKDRTTGRARGFGFVIFADSAVAERVAGEKHTIDNRQVEAKKAVPREEQPSAPRNSPGPGGLPGSFRTKKIFVGGLAPTVTEDDFKKYFEQYGAITDVVVMYDHQTQRPRGFGFITFEQEASVDSVLQKAFHELNGKTVEVKRAVPKEFTAPGARPGSRMGAGVGGSPGYGYGSIPYRGDRSYSARAFGYGGSGFYGASLNGGMAPYGGGSYGSGYGSGTGGGGYYGSQVSSGRTTAYGSSSSYGAAYAGSSAWTGASGRTGYGSAAYGSVENGGSYAGGYTTRSSGYSGRDGSTYGLRASGSYGASYPASYDTGAYGSYGSYNMDSSGAWTSTTGGSSGNAPVGYYGSTDLYSRQAPRQVDERYRSYQPSGSRPAG